MKNWKNMKITRKWVIRVAGGLVALALIGGAAWGLREWIRYPKKPDVARVKLEDVIAFIGTDEFNRLYDRDRNRYALAVANRLREKTFAQLLELMMNQRSPEVAENLRKMPGGEDVTSVMMSIFLDKFYEQNEAQRDLHLMLLVKTGQSRDARRGMEQRGLPPLEKFQKDFAKFLERQPPRVQGQVAQFMMDLRRQREIMGVPEPF